MYREPRTWPVAEDEIQQALAALWDGDVHQTWPADRPAEWVLIECDDQSAQGGVLSVAQMTVHVWSGRNGDNPRTVRTLASLIRDLLAQMPRGDNPITAWTEDTAAYLADEITGDPRVIITGTAVLKPSARIEEVSP